MGVSGGTGAGVSVGATGGEGADATDCTASVGGSAVLVGAGWLHPPSATVARKNSSNKPRRKAKLALGRLEGRPFGKVIGRANTENSCILY